MKRLAVICLAMLLALTASCAAPVGEPSAPDAVDTPVPDTPAPTETDTQPAHSEFYIPGLTADEVVEFFREVCLDREYGSEGNAALVQKWMEPIAYRIGGEPTAADMYAVAGIVQQLNDIAGFPGLHEAEQGETADLEIWFCSADELVDRMGEPFDKNHYGAATFWFDDNVINKGVICCRSDIDQTERISVIMEEIYNILGPIQDTVLREDSIIYQYSNANLELSPVDVLLLRLLYHPDIRCGMDAGQCSEIIRQLYD